MATTTHTRRSVMGAIAATPCLLLPDVALAASLGGDEDVVAAWEVRQRTWTAIEESGGMYDVETNAPELAAIFDDADDRIIRAEVSTARGALIKAWVALSFSEDSFTVRGRRLISLARHADHETLIRERRDLDVEHQMLLDVITFLRSLAGEA